MIERGKILIVDDRPENLFALESVLAPLGVQVIKAHNGNQALKATLHHDFALAIVDVQMPGMDGYELARLMRGPRETHTIPIIFLTAVFSDEHHVFKGYESGAVDFITKPFIPEILLSKVQVFLELDANRKQLMRSKADLESMVERRNRAIECLRHEIARRREVEQDLKDAKETAEAASRAKSEFLANMSHEIRTPMNGIMGMVELARMAQLPPQARDYLDMANQSACNLLAIVNDILDLAKIESGKAELKHEDFDLREVVDSTLRPLSISANKKGLALEFALDPTCPQRVVGDAGRLRQILTNLVGNAVKFTEQGRINVSVRPAPQAEDEAQPGEDADDGNLKLLFNVRDTGIGIASENLESIFESFSQVGSSAHVQYGGTGLGLAISKELVAMMGGRIWVQSQVGQGSTFHFSLRLEPGRDGEGSPHARPRREQPMAALRVLVAEDNTINQLYVSHLLEHLGHETAVVGTGAEALQALREQAYDVVLLDIRMPDMDGVETTQAIRSGAAGDPEVPVVALTAHALAGDRERFLSAGMDDYLSKPVESEALEKVLRRVMAKQ